MDDVCLFIVLVLVSKLKEKEKKKKMCLQNYDMDLVFLE